MDNYSLFDEQFRQSLKATCKLFGGQKAVANAAHIRESNLSKWLKGGLTLSPENIDAVLQVMGLPESMPDTSRVHVWHISSPPKGSMKKLDLISTLELYFPNGGEIAKAPWAFTGLNNLKRTIISWKHPMAVYAITDGHVRVVLRLSVGMLLQKENIKSYLKWRDGTEDMSILNIADTDRQWVEGVPSQSEFDSVWNDKGNTAKAVDLILAVREEGITFEEAIRRIQKN